MHDAPDTRVSFTWQSQDGTPLTQEEQERARRMVGQRVMGVFKRSEFCLKYVAPLLSALQNIGATDEELDEILRFAVNVWATPSKLDAFEAAFQRVHARVKGPAVEADPA